MRVFPLAALATLSSLCLEVGAKPHDNGINLVVNQPDVTQSIVTSQGTDESGTDLLAPLELSQADDEETEAGQTKDQEDSWRVYLDLYAFLVPITTSTTTINDNTFRSELPLSEVLNNLDEALTFRASVEYGRLGFMAGINHASLSASGSRSSYRQRTNPLRDQLGLPSALRQQTIEVNGDFTGNVDANQTIVDLALRYRVGAIQKPRMDKGSTSFLGLLGARIIDANITTDWSLSREKTVTVDGVRVNRERSRELERASGNSWGNTWVQPLIGAYGSYAISEDWQAFAYLDAGGFGLSGEQDLSGTAQAGIAYALGNSAQLSLSYKYFSLDYAGGGGNGYNTDQSGVNLGLRWLFD